MYLVERRMKLVVSVGKSNTNISIFSCGLISRTSCPGAAGDSLDRLCTTMVLKQCCLHQVIERNRGKLTVTATVWTEEGRGGRMVLSVESESKGREVVHS